MENEIKIVTIPLSNEELKNVLKEDNNEIYVYVEPSLQL